MKKKQQRMEMRELTDRFYANEMQFPSLTLSTTNVYSVRVRKIASSANEKLLIEMTTQLKL